MIDHLNPSLFGISQLLSKCLLIKRNLIKKIFMILMFLPTLLRAQTNNTIKSIAPVGAFFLNIPMLRITQYQSAAF